MVGRWLTGTARVGRTVASAFLALLAMFGAGAYMWLSARGSVPPPNIATMALTCIAVGTAAGVVSGSHRTAILAWLSGVLGIWLAAVANYTVDPSWPTSDSPLPLAIAIDGVALLPLIVGGHILGVAIVTRAARKPTTRHD